MNDDFRAKVRFSQAISAARLLVAREPWTGSVLRTAAELVAEQYGVDADEIEDHLLASRRCAQAVSRAMVAGVTPDVLPHLDALGLIDYRGLYTN